MSGRSRIATIVLFEFAPGSPDPNPAVSLFGKPWGLHRLLLAMPGLSLRGAAGALAARVSA